MTITDHTPTDSANGTGTTDAAVPEAAAPPRKRGRRIKRILGFTALGLGVAAAGGYFWLDSTADVKVAGNPDCTAVTPTGGPAGSRAEAHRAVCDRLSAMTRAWDSGDADAYGAQFTPDATYTTYVGTHYQGRRDITEGHRALFDGFVKGTKLADSYLAIRFYGTTTAIVTTRGDTYEDEPDAPADLSKTQTYTLVRDGADADWRIAAFHNTQRQRVMERFSFLYDADTQPAAEK